MQASTSTIFSLPPKQRDDAFCLAVSIPACCTVVCRLCSILRRCLIRIIAKASRSCKTEFSDHGIRNHIADYAKNTTTQITKLMRSPPRPAFKDIGIRVMKFQVSKGMETQVDHTGHGKGTSLQHCVNHVERQCAEHKHKLQRFRYTGQEHGQNSRNKHGTVILTLVRHQHDGTWPERYQAEVL